MTIRPRILLSLGLCLALAGCSAAQKTTSACTASGPAAVGEFPSTYENYTPAPQPLLSPVPIPPAEQPGENADVPPPPSVRTAPSKDFDFFEPANAEDDPQVNR